MNHKQTQILYLVISSFLLLGFIGWLDVIELRAEEPRRAIVAIEMLLSGEFIVPHINGWPYYNKPPFFNWLLVSAFNLFGSMDEWIVRLPSIISLLLTSIFTYVIAIKHMDKYTSMVAAFFLLTGGEILFYGSVNAGEIDLFFMLVVFLQIISIYYFYQKKNYWLLFIASYFFVGIGFLTKGLPSLPFQALTLIVLAIYHKDFKLIFSVQHIIGILLFAGIGLGYLIIYDQQEDAIGFIVRQTQEASQRTGLESKLTDILLQSITFPFQLIKLLLPWSLFLLVLIKKKYRKSIRSNSLVMFCTLFILINIPIYWFSGDFKARYLFPFFPFFCILGSYLYNYIFQNRKSPVSLYQNFFAVIMLLIPIVLLTFYFVPQTGTIPLFALKLALLIVVTSLLFALYIRFNKNLLWVVLMLAVVKIGFNVFGLPIIQKNGKTMYYRDAVEEMLKITGDNPIFLYGTAEQFQSTAKLPGVKFKEVTLRTAPLIAYQIPYNISRTNGHIMKFHEHIVPNNYYLMPETLSEQNNYKVLYEIYDQWMNRNMVLVKP